MFVLYYVLTTKLSVYYCRSMKFLKFTRHKIDINKFFWDNVCIRGVFLFENLDQLFAKKVIKIKKIENENLLTRYF